MPDPTLHPAAAPVEAMERTPLLGVSLVRFHELLEEATQALLEEPSGALVRRCRARFTEYLLATRAPGAAEAMVDIATRCRAARQEPLALRLHLLAVLAARAEGLDDLAATQLQRAQDHWTDPLPDAVVALRDLARASLGHPDALVLLSTALDRLPPSEDHTRLHVHLTLADHLERGGDTWGARRHLEAARQLARTHDDVGHAARTGLLLGSQLVRAGLPQDAVPALEDAVRMAIDATDSLVLTAAGSLLCGLHASEHRWESVLRYASVQTHAARERNNPVALLDAGLARANALLQLGDIPAMVATLLDLGEALAQRPRLLNVVQARVLELQSILGPEVWQDTLERLGVEPQDQ